MGILRGLVIGIVIGNIAACEFRAIHITIGDKYVRGLGGEHIYTIGFMSLAPCELSQLKVHLIFGNNLESSEPFIHERNYEAPPGSGVEYKRHFYFAHILQDSLKGNPCQFQYYLSHNKATSKSFEFKSQIVCKAEHRLFVLGNHDDSRIGMVTMESLYKEEFDGLIMAGNYVKFYHTENGICGDRYFEKIEPILATHPFLIIPGYNERFDDYKMFNSRFRMPGCDYDDLNCDVFGAGNQIMSLILVNIERTLFSPTIDRKQLLMKTKQVIDSMTVNNNGDPIWKLVVTNVPFVCSANDENYHCNAVIYYVKPFDDLFEQQKVNLLIQTAKPYYEAIKNVFNYEIKSSKVKQIMVAGAAGRTNFNVRPIRAKAKFSYFMSTQQQGVVELKVFDTYYKSDFLLVPSMVSIDLAYVEVTEIQRNWLLLGFCTLLFILVVLAMEYIHSNKMAAYFTEKKRETNDLRAPLENN